jgi:hypothetical protein
MLTPKQPIINSVVIPYIDYSITENYIGKMASFLPYTRPEPLFKVLHHISIWMVMSISKTYIYIYICNVYICNIYIYIYIYINIYSYFHIYLIKSSACFITVINTTCYSNHTILLLVFIYICFLD